MEISTRQATNFLHAGFNNEQFRQVIELIGHRRYDTRVIIENEPTLMVKDRSYKLFTFVYIVH